MLERMRNKSLVFILVALCTLASMAWGHSILYISAMDVDFEDSDAVLLGFLEGLGHDVNEIDDDESEEDTERWAAEADLVVISESCNSARIKEEITEVNVPMLITEMYAWDEMGLAMDVVESPDCATVNINIVNPDHPLAAGFSGEIPVLSYITSPRGTSRMASAHAGSEATVIAQATLDDGVTYDVLYVYEQGAALPIAPADDSNQVAANMRICFGFDEISFQVWNDNALDLFEAAVNYALNIKPSPEAYVPSPANGEEDVSRDVVLSWRPGRFAETHTVYFGTDYDDVNEATVEDDRGTLVAQDQTERSVDLGTLDYGQTYYWRVDEANAAPDTTVYTGNVWSFTIANFIVVDDFEAYDDEDPNRIFDTWLDGWDNPDENGMVVGYEDPDLDNGEHYAETDVINTGKQAMPLFYDTDMKVAEATVSLADAGMITDWTQDEVNDLSLWFQGAPGAVGAYTQDNGAFTIQAAGADIWGEADEFHFVYKELTGTMSIVAYIDSLVNTNGYAKAGIMMRDTLDAGARNTAIFFTPEYGTRLQRRASADGEYLDDDEETLYAGDPNDPNTFPRWLKLNRTIGGLVYAYTSTNGSDWEMFSLGRSMVTMSTPIYVGFAVTSHDEEVVTEAQISNVTLTGDGSDDAWMNQDVGITSNSGEDMYIVLNDKAVVYYEETDPNMPASPTQNDTWRNWVIPLQDFADQGVDMTEVESLILGVGNWGDSSSAGGSGQLYIDDIRLYRPPVE